MINRRGAALFLVIGTVGSSMFAENDVKSKTFFTARSFFTAGSPEREVLARDRVNRRAEGRGIAFNAVGYYSRTTDFIEDDNGFGLAGYFTPNGRPQLVVGELGSGVYQRREADVVANYFNLFSADYFSIIDSANLTYSSVLNFDPQRTVAGIGLATRVRLPKEWWFDWIEVALPIEKVTTDMRMTESKISDGGGLTASNHVDTMVAAFKQAAMKYGKIDGPRSEWGLANGEILIGRDMVNKGEHDYYGWYVGAVLPAGNKPTAEYLFEPVVGHNKHAGAAFGTYGRRVWKEWERSQICWYYNTDGRYLFENTQRRMLDLKNKPWGRYIWLVKKGQLLNINASNTPFVFGGDIEFGTNITTQNVIVRPQGSLSATTGLCWMHHNGWELEGGVNVYARNAEEVRLEKPFANVDTYGIPAIDDLADSYEADKTKSYTTIGQTSRGIAIDLDAGGAEIFVPLTEGDLDLASASSPAVIESTVYASAGKNWDDWDVPTYMGVGGSFTFSGNNAGAERWALWGKFGMSF